MKLSQILALLMLLIAGSVMAFADGIGDPQIIIHGAGGNSAVCPVGGCTSINGLTFSFTVPASGSGSLFFTNNSGQNWTSLALIEQCSDGCAVPAADIKCHSSLFGSCSVETLSNGNVEILLQISESENPNTGIKNGQNFAITFACVKTSCWPGGVKFDAGANGASTVPEPGTIALMVTGLGAMVSRRKLWKNRFNS